jgi:hypothetical protein
MTLILTFSLREKELSLRAGRSIEGNPLELPLPEGEGWGEGPVVRR